MPTEARSRLLLLLSLGGTKLEFRVLGADGQTHGSSGELLWRRMPEFQRDWGEDGGAGFCSELARLILSFLKDVDLGLEQIHSVGIPFPGPSVDGRWYSNNLVDAFRNGVALESQLNRALHECAIDINSRFPEVKSAIAGPKVQVVFDAQCDAGGELYHDFGRLHGCPSSPATVLNIATGVAAGFVAGGRVLIGNEAIRQAIDDRYDGGAGQFGRHLWLTPGIGWRYHFAPNGSTPEAKGIRMTERLSGPALAARLLHRLVATGQLAEALWSDQLVTFAEVERVASQIGRFEPNLDGARMAGTLRATRLPVATALLRWADAHYVDGASPTLQMILDEFAKEIAAELAEALIAWGRSDVGWEPFARRVVLTGGVGIHFLASGDRRGGFLAYLNRALTKGWRAQRSVLVNAAEREGSLFLCQLMSGR